jgi:hypothetical protein
MKFLNELEYVSWRFLGVCSVLLYGPFFYFMWISVHEDKLDTGTPYAFALILSIMFGAFITAGFNSYLQRRVALREKAAEEEARVLKEEKLKQKKVKKKNG